MSVSTIPVPTPDVQPGDRVFLGGSWRPVTANDAVGPAARFLSVLGSHGVRRASSTRTVVRRDVQAPAPAPELPEPTNPVVVPVAEFKRALVPGSRWLVTNHVVTSGPAVGTTERTVLRANTVDVVFSVPGADPATDRGSHMAWPKRGMVQRADGGVFLVYSPREDADPALFLTIRPAS